MYRLEKTIVFDLPTCPINQKALLALIALIQLFAVGVVDRHRQQRVAVRAGQTQFHRRAHWEAELADQRIERVEHLARMANSLLDHYHAKTEAYFVAAVMVWVRWAAGVTCGRA